MIRFAADLDQLVDTDAPAVVDPDDAPLDDWSVGDGSDTVYAGVSVINFVTPGHGLRFGEAANEPLAVAARVVPFGRQIKAGTHGKDVVAVKRALAVWAKHADHPEWFPWRKTWTVVFGPLAVRALKRFQKRHDLKVDGVYGPSTHKLLASFYDAYGARLLQQFPHATAADKVVAEAFWGYHNRAAIHYAQWRPIDGHGHPHKLPLYTDCSGSVTDWYEWAGQKDPNGFGFNGLGYTGTLIDHGVRVTGPARPGNLAFYGWNAALRTAEHVAVYVSSTRVVSLGSEIGPLLLDHHYRSDLWQVRSYL